METFPVVRMAVLLAGSLVVLAIGVGLLRTKEAGAEGEAPPCHRVQNGVHRLCGHLVQSPGAH